jgi:muconate cycloisomerase
MGGLLDAVALCDNVRFAAVPEGARDCFGNSLKCALELSVLDAVGRALGVPLSSLTELLPEAAAIRHSVPQVRYSATITSMGAFKAIFRACTYRYYGFHQLKVKVGVAGVNDAAVVRRIRRAAGPRFDLRIDANEAWTCENLESKLAPLLPYRISSLEQPVPHAAVDGLAAVRKRIETPIMLDESACSLSDAHRAIERGTCDLFNIRLSKCGGFVNSLRIAAAARRAGLGYQMGCQVGETGILSAAGRHFAASVADLRYLEGSYDRFLVAERLTREDLTFGRGGYAPALTGPGLSVEIDREGLRRVTIGEEHFRIN